MWTGSLWLGTDHLLAVSGTRFGERYRRYYFQDIQSITIRKQSLPFIPAWWAVVFLIALLAALLSLAPALSRLAYPALGALAALLFYFAYASLTDSCVCHVQTATSRDELPCPRRLGPAQKALDIISAKITEAQGELPEGWTESFDNAPFILAAVPEVDLPAQGQSAKTLNNMDVAFPAALFLCLFADAIVTFFQIKKPTGSAALAISGNLLLIAQAVAVAACFYRLQGAPAARILRKLILATALFIGLTSYGSYAINYVQGALQQAARQKGVTAPRLPVQQTLAEINVGGDILFGVAGLSLVLQKARAGG